MVLDARRYAERFDGDGFEIDAVAGCLDLRLADAVTKLDINDQDVEPLCLTLMESAEDGMARMVESCMISGRRDDWHQLLVDVVDGHVRIQASYDPRVLCFPLTSAHAISVKMLEAFEHATCGPCPLCGTSVADDHPINGCP